MKKNPLIVALDVADKDTAVSLVKQLGDQVSIYKIGPVLFTKYGPSIVQTIKKMGKDIFLDLKLHDIPNTVASAVAEIAELGISMFTVHITGGREMLQQAVETLRKYKKSRPKIIGVTILTSISEESLHQDLKISIPLLEQVINLANLAKDSGLDGVVASPQEVAAIRKFCGSDLLIITPGVRPAGSATGDQKRTATPREALQNGADYIVVGRPITQSPQPVEVVKEILSEIK